MRGRQHSGGKVLAYFRAGVTARVLGFLGLCLALGGLVGIWTIEQYQQVAEKLAFESAKRLGDFTGSIGTQIVRNGFSTLQAMSGFQRVQGMNPKDCSDVARFFLNSSLGYSNIGAVTPAGDLYCSALKAPHPVNHRDAVWFKRTMQTGAPAVGNFQINPVNGKQIITFSMPLKNPDGSIAQIIFASLETAYIESVIRLPSLPAGSTVTVIDQDGNLLVDHPAGSATPGENMTHWPIAARGASAATRFVMEGTGLDGSRRFYASTGIYARGALIPGIATQPTKSISIIIGVPAKRDIATLLTPLKASGAAIGLVFLLILTGTYIFLSRTMLRPIRQIHAAARQLRRGDFSVRLPATSRRDEIGMLSNSFNEMASALAERDSDLRQTSERLRRILDTEPGCVKILDRDLRFVDINRAGAELMCAPDIESVRGADVLDFVAEEDHERFRAHILSVIDGRRESITYQLVDCNGDRHWIESHAAAIRLADDAQHAYIAISRDKTEELKTAAQLVQAQKMESIGRLTGGVAHDFNNLLTVMLGNAEVLVERLADRPELRHLAGMIEQAAQRGSELTHRMLAFARRQVLRPTELDVNTLVTQLTDLIGRTLGEDVRVRLDTAPGLWHVSADPAQMESALLNLALNARDAMPDGGMLTIETSNVHLDADYAALNPAATPGDYVLVAVSDSGTGMTPAVMEKAFDPFFTTKPTGKGSGLGLSMVYGFVKQSQGHIKIYSEAGQGTTIRIYLPKSAEGTAVREIPEAVHETDVNGQETILVVEDEEAVRAYVCAQLRDLGYRVLEAPHAEAALAIFEGEDGASIDLLFTDVVLPGGLNGRQLAERAALLHPRLKVLYTTGYTENAVVHNGKLDAGVQLLTKPYRRADLARQIRQALFA